MFSQSYSHMLLNQIWKIYFSNFLYCFKKTNKQPIIVASGQALCASDIISLQSKPLEILQIFLITQNRGQPLRHRPQ